MSAVHTFEKMIHFKIIFEQISHSAEGAEGDDDYSSHASTKMFHPGQLTSTLLQIALYRVNHKSIICHIYEYVLIRFGIVPDLHKCIYIFSIWLSQIIHLPIELSNL